MTMRVYWAVLAVGFALAGTVGPPIAAAHPSEPGVVNYAVLGKGSVGNIVGGPMGWESVFTQPGQGTWVDLPECNNWADIGLSEVYDDPDLASFNGAVTQTSASDQTHLVKQAVGVFATPDAAARAFHRVVDRTVGCSGQTTAIHLDNGSTQVWSFDRGAGRARRRELDQAGGGHRSALLRSNQAARKRVAAGESVSVGQRRARRERASWGDAERAGSVVERLGIRPCRPAIGAGREYVGGV